jgi:secondary thiamine-phosphate synthase enzyme
MDGSAGARRPWPAAVEAGGWIDFGVSVGRVRVASGTAVSVLDLTERVEGFVRAARLRAGWVNVQTRHTTTGICVNENEPLLIGDLLSLLERVAPRGPGLYQHDDLDRRAFVPPDERPNGHAHAKALLLRTAETLNVADGRLQLGRWQRVLLLDLDGPRDREVSLLAMGERAV